MKKLKIVLLMLLLPLGLVGAKIATIGKKIPQEELAPYLMSKEISTNQPKITFLGTSCFVIDWKGSTFLSDPFFSNPGPLQMITGLYIDREHLIDDLLKSMNPVSMITVSHGHHDHCLDLPAFDDKLRNNTTFIADPSVVNGLMPWLRQYHLNTASAETHEDVWIYSNDRKFRVRAYASEHHCHVGKVKLFAGSYQEALDKVPGPVWQWREGNTYCYLLDLMDGDEIRSRLLLSYGHLPEESLKKIASETEEHNIDYLLHAYWHHKKSEESLELIYQYLQPEEVLFHHWNNFFKRPEASLQSIRSAKLEQQLSRHRERGEQVRIMMPFSSSGL